MMVAQVINGSHKNICKHVFARSRTASRTASPVQICLQWSLSHQAAHGMAAVMCAKLESCVQH